MWKVLYMCYCLCVHTNHCVYGCVRVTEGACAFLSSCTANYTGVTELQDGKLGRQGGVSLSQFDTRMKVYYSIYTLTWPEVHVDFCRVQIRQTLTSDKKKIKGSQPFLFGIIDVSYLNHSHCYEHHYKDSKLIIHQWTPRHNEPWESDVTMLQTSLESTCISWKYRLISFEFNVTNRFS